MNARRKRSEDPARDRSRDEARPEDLDRAGRVQWERPPQSVRDRVRRPPAEELLADVEPIEVVSVTPDDVRAAETSLDEGEEIVISRSHEAADLTVSVQPPAEDGTWHISGRVWLTADVADATRIHVALVHDDHVLLTREAEDGEFFELEEVLPRGWQLEVHLPGGLCLRVDDPRS